MSPEQCKASQNRLFRCLMVFYMVLYHLDLWSCGITHVFRLKESEEDARARRVQAQQQMRRCDTWTWHACFHHTTRVTWGWINHPGIIEIIIISIYTRPFTFLHSLIFGSSSAIFHSCLSVLGPPNAGTTLVATVLPKGKPMSRPSAVLNIHLK